MTTSPFADWVHEAPKHYDAPTRRFMAERGFFSPNFVLVTITPDSGSRLPRHWGLDDLLKLAAEAYGGTGLQLMNSEWRLMPSDGLERLKGLFLDMEIRDRLKVRDLPTREALA